MSSDRITIPTPTVGHLARGESVQDRYRAIAHRLENGRDLGGRWSRESVAALLLSVADALDTPTPTATPAGEPEATPGRITEAMVQRAAEALHADECAQYDDDCECGGAVGEWERTAQVALEAALNQYDQPVSLTAGELRAEHIGQWVEFYPWLSDDSRTGVYSTTMIRADAIARICHDHFTTEVEVDATIYELPHDTPVTLLPEGGER